MKNKIIHKRLEENGGKWLGFKTGINNEVVVRIRRTTKKYFYLIVDKYISGNKITVRDLYGKEYGVAIRFDKESFSLESQLKE